MAQVTFIPVADNTNTGFTRSSGTTDYVLLDEGSPSNSATDYIIGPNASGGGRTSVRFGTNGTDFSSILAGNTVNAVTATLWYYYENTGVSGPADSITLDLGSIWSDSAMTNEMVTVSTLNASSVDGTNTWLTASRATNSPSVTSGDTWANGVYFDWQQASYQQNGCADSVIRSWISAITITVDYSAAAAALQSSLDLTKTFTVAIPAHRIFASHVGGDYFRHVNNAGSAATGPDFFLPLSDSNASSSWDWSGNGITGSKQGTHTDASTANPPPLQIIDFPATSLLTSFTGTDEEPISESGAWASTHRPVSATIDENRRVGNKMGPTTVGTVAGESMYATTYNADCEVWATMDTMVNASNAFGLYARCTGNATTAYDGVQISYQPDTGIRIWEQDSGSGFVQLGSTVAITLAAGDKLGLRCEGDQLKGYFYTNGMWQTDTRLWATTTKTGGGLIGTYISAGSVNARLDDFGGGNLTTTRVPWNMNSIDLQRTNSGGDRIQTGTPTPAASAVSAYFSIWAKKHSADQFTESGSLIDVINGTQNYGLWYDDVNGTIAGGLGFGYNAWNNDIQGISGTFTGGTNGSQSTIFPVGMWQHIAGKYVSNGSGSSTANQLWINGVERTVSNIRNTPGSQTALTGFWYLGAGAGPAHGWDGELAAAAVWYDNGGGSLSTDDISRLFRNPSSIVWEGASAATADGGTKFLASSLDLIWAAASTLTPTFKISSASPYVWTATTQAPARGVAFSSSLDLIWTPTSTLARGVALQDSLDLTWDAASTLVRGVALQDSLDLTWDAVSTLNRTATFASSLDLTWLNAVAQPSRTATFSSSLDLVWAAASNLARGVALSNSLDLVWAFATATPQLKGFIQSSMDLTWAAATDLTRGVALLNSLDLVWTPDVAQPKRTATLQSATPEVITFDSVMTHIATLANSLDITMQAATDLLRGVALQASEDLTWAAATDMQVSRALQGSLDLIYDAVSTMSRTATLSSSKDMVWDAQSVLTYIARLASSEDLVWDFTSTLGTTGGGTDAALASSLDLIFGVVSALTRIAPLVSSEDLIWAASSTLSRIATLTSQLALSWNMAATMQRGVALAGSEDIVWAAASTLSHISTLSSQASLVWAAQSTLSRTATMQTSLDLLWNFYSNFAGAPIGPPQYRTLMGAG